MVRKLPAGPAGSYTFTVTPNDGTFSGTPQTVSIAVTAPAASGGGGGAMGSLDVFALLSLAALGLYFGRQHGTRGKKK